MAIFTLPFAETVRIKSRLRPNQVDLNFRNDAELQSDIDARIQDAAVFVETRILEATSAAAWAAMTGDEATRRNAIATQATTFLALASLYDEASVPSAANIERADRYTKRANDLLDALAGDLQSGVTTGVSTRSSGATLSTAAYYVDDDGLLVANA